MARRKWAVLACAALGLAASPAFATTLRVVSYNIDDADQGNDNNITASYAGLPAVLQAIGIHKIAGNAQPIDVLGVEELNATTLPNLVNALNNLYGAGTYAYDNTPDPNTGGGPDALIYNTHTVQILSATAVGTANTSGAARAPMRYQIQPIGYGTSASFYMYVSHYKASSGASNLARRNVEAQTIRTDADALGAAAHIIYSGDFNLTSGSSEAAYATLTGAGNGRAYDPVDPTFISAWTNSSSAYKYLYTESTSSLTARFDFQLVSGAVLNQPGLQLAPDASNPNYPYAYQVFGNNGTTAVNGLTNAAGNTSLGDLGTNAQTILNDLMEPYAGNSNQFVGSDHLPVVADYNLVGVAQVPIFWLGGTSTWSTAAKWSTTVVPNNSSIKLQIDSGNATGSVVTLNQNAVIQDLAIDANDTLNISAGQILLINGPTNSTITGRINNAGTLAIGGGTTQFLNSGSHTGFFMTSTGATLDFHSGTQTFASDALFSGNGLILFSGANATAARILLGAGGGTITLSQIAGTLTTTGNVVLGNVASSTATFNLSGGSLSVGGLLQIGNSGTGIFTQTGGTLIASGLVQTGGTVTLGGTQSAYTLGAVSINAGITKFSTDGAKVLIASSLTLSGTGKLDLTNNDMIVHLSSPAALQSALASGFNNGAFNAAGITSSYAPAHPSQGFGALSGADFLSFYPGQTFDGQTVTANDVLVKYTYLGDATFDGIINGDDYLQIDRGYLEHLIGWINGDFNYDGTVDFQDFALIDAANAAQSGPLADGEIAAHAAAFGQPYLDALSADVSTIPEPASLALLAAAIPFLLHRRHTRRD